MPTIKQYTRQFLPQQTIRTQASARAFGGDTSGLQAVAQANQQIAGSINDVSNSLMAIQARRDESEYVSVLTQVELDRMKLEKELSTADFEDETQIPESYVAQLEERFKEINIPASQKQRWERDFASMRVDFYRSGQQEQVRREGIKTKLDWENTIQSLDEMVRLNPNSISNAENLLRAKVATLPNLAGIDREYMLDTAMDNLREKQKQYIAEANEAARATAIFENKDFTLGFNPFSSKDAKLANKYFESNGGVQGLVQMSPSTASSLVAAAEENYLPSSASDTLANMFLNGNIQQKAFAADLISNISERSPLLASTNFQSAEFKDALAFNMFTEYMDVEAASNKLRTLKDVDPMVAASRRGSGVDKDAEKSAKNIVSDIRLFEDKQRITGFGDFLTDVIPWAGNLGKTQFAPNVEENLTAHAQYLYKLNYERYGDPKIAEKITKREMHTNFGVTRVNGKPQIMRNPPERLLTMSARVHDNNDAILNDYIKSQIVEAFGEEEADSYFITSDIETNRSLSTIASDLRNPENPKFTVYGKPYGVKYRINKINKVPLKDGKSIEVPEDYYDPLGRDIYIYLDPEELQDFGNRKVIEDRKQSREGIQRGLEQNLLIRNIGGGDNSI